MQEAEGIAQTRMVDTTMAFDSLTRDDMLRIVAARDTTYRDRFIIGVVTTGIFCVPGCPARTPKPDNMVFYPDIPAAAAAGFRPCKRCCPLAEDDRAAQMAQLAHHIEAHADETLGLDDLAAPLGLTSSTLHRRFKKYLGLSPKAFQEAIRMRRLKAALRTGDDVTGAIFEAGYGSVSRVYGEASRDMGMTLSTYRAGGKGETIFHATRPTRFGLMMMGATERGVCFVQFGPGEEALTDQLRGEFPKAELVSGMTDGPALDHWITALEQHLDEGRPHPDLPLDLKGTAFQMKVWQFLRQIPPGKPISYADLASAVGNPKAVRAAASACARNRVAVLVPCHRVLRGDGSLGGYRWGLDMKRQLLAAEQSGN